MNPTIRAALATPVPLVLETLKQSIDAYLAGDVPLDRDTALWHADIAAYLGRTSEAREALAVARLDPLREVLLAECDIADGSPDAARERLERLDAPIALRARHLLALATTAQMRGAWAEMRRHAEEAIVYAGLARDPAMKGRALRSVAVSISESAGDTEESAELQRRGLDLVAVEGLRYCAFAQMSVAGTLVAEGRAGEAVPLLDAAENALLYLGLERHVQTCQHSRAWADLVAGNYEDALARSLRSLPVDRAQLNLLGEGWALETASLAALYAEHLDQAEELARALVEVRRLGGTEEALAEAHVGHLRVLMRKGDREAARDLDGCVADLDGDAARPTACHARMMQIDGWMDIDLARAFALYRRLGDVTADPGALAESRHLTARWAAHGIRLDGRAVVFDPAGGLPCRKTAHLMIDDYLAEEARAKTQNDSDAARLLCVTRDTFWEFTRRLGARLGLTALPPSRRERWR